MSQAKPNVILGTMTFGSSGEGSRIHDQAQVEELLSYFKNEGYSELDTARMYCEGNTEIMLGDIGVQTEKWGFKLATKVYPWKAGDHQPERLRATFETSLKALKQDSVDIFYLHAPDNATPIYDTLKEVNELHKEGKFKELGVSNYKSWEVAEIYYICKQNSWVLPTIYQGMYNMITRQIENELFSCLKKFNIRFYAYNPLCGGLNSGDYKIEDIKTDGSRFDPTRTQGKRYRERYWKQDYFEALELIKQECSNQQISLVEVALRWIVHHSNINVTAQDAVIIGVSSLNHLKDNLAFLQKGPLDEKLVQVIDSACLQAKRSCPPYFR